MARSSTQSDVRPPATAQPTTRRRSFLRAGWISAGLIGLVVVAVIIGRVFRSADRQPEADRQSERTAPVDHATGRAGQQVTLTASKARTTGLRLATVRPRSLQRISVVPGRVAHNPAQRIELRAPADGTVLSISVKPSDRLKPGDVLAVLQIPEIGTLRAKVSQRQVELVLALQTARRAKTVYDNLESLMAALEKRPTPREIQQRFRNRILGKYREQVLSAYSRFLLADRLAADAKPLAAKGIVSGRAMKERTGARDVAEAAYRSIREQVLFVARQARDRARLAADDARRQLAISKGHLAVDLGYDEDPSTGDSERKLSIAQLRAPIAGTVEERHVAETERFDEAKLLFVIANTSTLIIKADIREKEWSAIALRPGTRLSVEIPALPDKRQTATLRIVGRQVDARSRALPLVASIDNSQGLLRPGLFVRIRIPMGPSRTVPAVPSSAVMRQGQTAFVFQATGPRTYRKVAVRTGIDDGNWTEIVSGVKPGDRVVDRAAFALKSELLLEGEQE